MALRMTSSHLQGKDTLINQSALLDTAAKTFGTRAPGPLEGVFTLRSEIVDVRLEMQFEDVVLVNVFGLRGDGDGVTQQRKAGQRIIILCNKDLNKKVFMLFGPMNYTHTKKKYSE